MGMGGMPGEGAGAAAADAGGKAKVAKAKEASSNKFKRVAGGKSWEDETLAEWPESEGGNTEEGRLLLLLCTAVVILCSFEESRETVVHTLPASLGPPR